LTLSFGAEAQVNPGPPQGAPPVNPVCPRLEAQLATIDRGGTNDPAKDEQIRRYQDAAAKQQAELDRVNSQAKRMGCDSSGFFSMLNNISAQSGPVNTRSSRALHPGSDSLEPVAAAWRRFWRRARQPAPFGPDRAGAEQLRPAICQRCSLRPRQLPEQPVRRRQQQSDSATHWRSGPAIGHLSHGLRPELRRRLLPISFATVPTRLATTRGAARRSVRRQANLFTYRNPGEA
jgi:hypothetical protein